MLIPTTENPQTFIAMMRHGGFLLTDCGPANSPSDTQTGSLLQDVTEDFAKKQKVL